MKFIYSTQEPEVFAFRRVGGELTESNTVTLTDAGYRKFLQLTEGTTHQLTLYKETTWKSL